MGRESIKSVCGGRKGRFGGRGRNRSRFANKSKPQREIKFFPHSVGQATQSVTFDTVKDHIVNQVQRQYRNGIDIVESLEKEVLKDLSMIKPPRVMSTVSDTSTRAIEQEGLDIKYKILIGEHHKRVIQLEENLTKCYALIFGTYCNHTMQLRIEEHKDFESTIKNDPITLLKCMTHSEPSIHMHQ